MNQYAIMAVVVACVAAWGGWQKIKRNEADLETKAVRASLDMAEDEAERAAKDATHNATVAKAWIAEAERRAKVAADHRAKERLAWMARDKLKKELANVPTSQNLPVSDHLELLLDAQRVRGVVPGETGASGPDKAGDGENPGAAGSDVPATTEPTS